MHSCIPKVSGLWSTHFHCDEITANLQSSSTLLKQSDLRWQTSKLVLLQRQLWWERGESCRRVTGPCEPAQAGEADGNWWQVSCSGRFSKATKNLPLSPQRQPCTTLLYTAFSICFLPGTSDTSHSAASRETLLCEVTANHHTGWPFPATCLQALSAAPYMTGRTLMVHVCPAGQSWCPGDAVPRWHSLPTDPAWAQAWEASAEVHHFLSVLTDASSQCPF